MKDGESHITQSHVDVGCKIATIAVCTLVNLAMSIVDDSHEDEVSNIESYDDESINESTDESGL